MTKLSHVRFIGPTGLDSTSILLVHPFRLTPGVVRKLDVLSSIFVLVNNYTQTHSQFSSLSSSVQFRTLYTPSWLITMMDPCIL